MADDGGKGRVSPRRLQQAYRDGHVPRTRWAAHVAVWGLAAALLNWTAVGLAHGLIAWRRTWATSLEYAPQRNDSAVLTSAGEFFGGLVWPLLGTLIVVAVLVGISGLQTGFRPFPHRFQRPEVRWPGAGLADSAVWSRFVLTIFYLSAMLVAVAAWGWYRSADLWLAASQPTWDGVCVAARTLAEALAVLAAVSGLASVAEYGLSYWQLRYRLGMSDQEWREEIKAIEGDPRVEARQRELHRRLSGPASSRSQRE